MGMIRIEKLLKLLNDAINEIVIRFVSEVHSKNVNVEINSIVEN